MSDPFPCPLCGALAPSSFNRAHTDREVSYHLYRCEHCLVEFWWPLKNPGAAWYEHDERYAGRNEAPILEPNWNHKKIISYLAPRRGRVLDVGCGVGNFLAHAREHGWEPHGIDFDADAIEAGKRTFGLKELEVADIAGYRKAHPQAHFDLITFFDVLEHIDDHAQFMEHVRALLTESGHIAMSMPYRRHAHFLMPGDLPPRHLTRWDRTSLAKFLEREGFRVVYMTRRTEGLRYLIIKLRFRFGKKVSFGLVNRAAATSGSRKSLLTRLASFAAKAKDAALFGLPALLVYLAMLGSSRRYVTLYAIAQKE